jgi:protein-tyrosine kinase
MMQAEVKPDQAPVAADRMPGAPLGQQLILLGKLTEEEVLTVRTAQINGGLRFGEAAMRLGLLTEDDVQVALARQYDYPYVLPNQSAIKPEVHTAYRPFSKRAEALRELRSQLMLRWFGDRISVIAVASARAGEGTSILAANLAVVFSQLGERTALIDANFRRPAQHKLFGLTPAGGLSSLLIGRVSVNEVFTPVPDFDNLSVLCAGATPPNPQELLSSVGFSYLVETTPAMFDIVIIDTPPVLECADAQIVIDRAGGCLLSTRLNQSRLADIEQVKARLQPTRSKIVGTVLNE